MVDAELSIMVLFFFFAVLIGGEMKTECTANHLILCLFLTNMWL